MSGGPFNDVTRVATTSSLSWVEEYVSGRTTELNGAFARHKIMLTEDQFEQAMKGIEGAIRDADEASHATPDNLPA